MAILKNSTISTPQPPAKEILLRQKANRIMNITAETFNNIIHVQRQGIVQLWEDTNLTPQEIIDELGPNAIKIFQFHGALTQFIQTLAQIDEVTVELKQPTNAFTLSGGVITVTEDPYIP